MPSSSRKNQLLEAKWRKAEALLDAGASRKAFRLFLSAARAGHLASQNTVGYLFNLGRGTARSKGQALAWYRRAAKRGDPSATNNIGTFYRDEGQFDLALRWFKKAVRLGNDGALLEIAKIYAGPLKDAAKALRFLEAALEPKRILSECEAEEARVLRARLRRRRAATRL